MEARIMIGHTYHVRSGRRSLYRIATPMRLEAIAIGINPPDDVNVVIEVPIGGEPIKYEMDKAAGTLVVDRFLHLSLIHI